MYVSVRHATEPLFESARFAGYLPPGHPAAPPLAYAPSCPSCASPSTCAPAAGGAPSCTRDAADLV